MNNPQNKLFEINSPLVNYKQKLSEFKELTIQRNPEARALVGVDFPNTKINFEQKVGNPLRNSALTSVLEMLTSSFTEAKIQLYKRRDLQNDVWTVEHDSDVEEIIANPNAYYNGKTLLQGVITDYLCYGNSYIYKVRNKNGKVISLYYFPHFDFEPKGNKGTFITHYSYKGLGKEVIVPTKDVIHLRRKFDENNYLLGRGLLPSLLRELCLDNELINMLSQLILNGAMPRFVVTPADKDYELDPDTQAEILEAVNSTFTGDGRGKTMVLSAPMTFEKMQFSPNELNLDTLHALPEERIATAFKVPTSLVGFGSSGKNADVGNYKEARDNFYKTTVIPLQKEICDQIQRQLLWEFENTKEHVPLENPRNIPKGIELRCNLRDIPILQDDNNSLITRLDIGVRGRWITRAEARAAAGYQVKPGDDIYLEKEQSIPLNNPQKTPDQIGKPNKTERIVMNDRQQRQTPRPDQARKKDLLNDYHEKILEQEEKSLPVNIKRKLKKFNVKNCSMLAKELNERTRKRN